jgi:UrcA family protein
MGRLKMFSILLLGFAAAIGPQATVTAEAQPTVGINLAGYNLREDQEVRRIQLKIREAAKYVCARGYGAAIYDERVACVKSAIADGDRQLDRIVGRVGLGPSLATTAATISISIK